MDGASLRFTETGQSREDSWEIEWEATPVSVDRNEDLDTPPPLVPVGRPLLGDGLETLPQMFDGLHIPALQRDLDTFDVIDVHAGETLIRQGDAYPAAVVLLRGALRAFRGDEQRRVFSGEVLGLTTLFGDGVWPTTLFTGAECRLMVLDLAGYQALRERGSLVSLAIEEWSLAHFLEALGRTAERLARSLPVQPVEQVVADPGPLSRLRALVAGGAVRPARVAALAALSRSPAFADATEEVLADLAPHFRGLRAEAGEMVITEGEPGSLLYVVVSGAVDVLSVAGQNRVVRHASLGPGRLFGAHQVLRDDGGWASVVAAEPTALLTLDKLRWAELATASDSAGSVLRLAVLRALCQRLVHAADRVAELEHGTTPPLPSDRFVPIRPAAVTGRR